MKLSKIVVPLGLRVGCQGRSQWAGATRTCWPRRDSSRRQKRGMSAVSALLKWSARAKHADWDFMGTTIGLQSSKPTRRSERVQMCRISARVVLIGLWCIALVIHASQKIKKFGFEHAVENTGRPKVRGRAGGWGSFSNRIYSRYQAHQARCLTYLAQIQQQYQ